jgi:3-hydroxyacyl-CoA dehydrogenase
MTIKKAAVIGAGVMGAGIAAQLANAGFEVELLDRVLPGNADRDAVARGAIEKMAKTNPAPLMHKSYARRIRPGNTDDNIDRLKDADIIIEAVFEDPKVKYDIFQKIDANRKPGSIVASNTSTIPLKNLVEGQSEQFKKDFVITHFFNPPRYMPLLELITSSDNSPEMVQTVTRFMDEKMGKGVVVCKDTPGFIANRIGTFWIQASINEAIKGGLTVEEADAIVGKPMGVPKTGIFGLVDLVGLDLMPHISKSLLGKLPATDGYAKIAAVHPVIEQMIKDGYTGRKGKGGFYRRNDKKEDFAVDLNTGAERPKKKVKMQAAENAKKGGLKGLVETKDKGGAYAWSVLKQTLSYAAEHVHDISSSVLDVDQAMKLGYNWKWGPFEMIDKLGTDYVINRLKAEGDAVPAFLEKAAGRTFYKTENGQLKFLNKDGDYQNVVRPDGVLLLSDIKRASKPVADNTKNVPGIGKMGAALWDIGDGVLCLEFTSKMNSLDFFTLKMMNRACDIIEKKEMGGKYKALVIHNEGEDFSVGANIGVAMLAAKWKQYWIVEKMVRMGQETYKRLKYASFPVVSAPAGKALGGGCEILMHSHHVQAHAETYAGLVEVGVGLLPAWGGSTELLTRALQSKKLPKGPMPPAAHAFETISTAKVGLSAFEAKDLMYFRDTDGVTMNKSRLLADAKAKAIEMAKDFKPEQPFDLALPGPSGLAAFRMAVDGAYLKGAATTYDVVVSDRVARVLTGGEQAGPGALITQDRLRELEFEHFMALVHDPRTVARIESMIKAGKPLREAPDAKETAITLRDSAEQKPSFLSRIPILRNIFGAHCKKDAANDNGVVRDTKAKMNWPNIKK